MSQTWYLKYRPQTVDELDLGVVREKLKSALSGKNIPHAWLFAGSRGLGKTSAARILAKAVNCQEHSGKGAKGQSREPCNKCEVCVAIAKGNCPDVVEIDAASNRGIEDIRALKDKIGLAPIQATTKVYIIDEVHMLTAEAANALLKTLEEPPVNTIFVLCTTEADKLLPTVVSRCARVDFARPTSAEMVRLLEKVAKGEKLKYTAEALHEVAIAADGSFRDGVKLLEQVSLQKGKLAVPEIYEVLGVVAGVQVEQLLQLIEQKEAQQSVELVEKLVAGGVDVRGLVYKLVDAARKKLLADLRQAQVWLPVIEKLDRAYGQMKETAVAQLPLEVAIIELGQNTKSESLNPKQIQNPNRETISLEQKAKSKEQKQIGEIKNGHKLADLTARWGEILREVKGKNHSVEALLRSTKPTGFDGRRLELEVFYKFHKDKLGSDKCKAIVEEAVGKVFGGGKISLDLNLGGKREQQSEVEGAVDEEVVRAAEEVFGVKAV